MSRRLLLRATTVALLTAAQIGALSSEAVAQPAPEQPAPVQPSTAQPAPEQPAPSSSTEGWAEADKLFAEGRAALARPRDLDKACDILARSYALRQRGDTLLNLAECHRRQGKTATAWREFDEAIRYAMKVEFPEAIAAAVTRRDELALRLSVMFVEVDARALPSDLNIVLDGKVLPSQQWNEALYVDPGEHRVTATATGYEPYEHSVEVGAKGGSTSLPVTLKQLPPPPPPPPPAPPPAALPPTAPPPPPHETPVWPFVVGGVGIAAMAVGGVFGIDSLGAGSELDAQCTDLRKDCPPDYDFDAARGRELRGFGLFVGLGIAGLAATTVGALGFVLSGNSDEKSVALTPWASPDGAGVTVRGAAW